VSAVHERPVQRNSEALGLGAEGQGFVVEVDFQLTPSFLVVEMEDRRHRFRGAELQLPCLKVFTSSTACQSPSACMICRSSAYAYFLEMVLIVTLGTSLSHHTGDFDGFSQIHLQIFAACRCSKTFRHVDTVRQTEKMNPLV